MLDLEGGTIPSKVGTLQNREHISIIDGGSTRTIYKINGC
jgi:hypothetical protein